MSAPNGRMPGPTFNPADLKLVACACGETKRIPVRFLVVAKHPQQLGVLVALDQQAWVCLGCDRQLDTHGRPLKPEDPAYLTDDQLEKLMGGTR